MPELVERLASGEHAAFAAFYDVCGDQLHHYLVVRLGSREDASDVLQETFVRLVRARKEFTWFELFGWLERAATLRSPLRPSSSASTSP